MKGLSDDYKVQGIYQNALWGLIFGIIVLVALAAGIPILVIGGVFSVFTSGLAGVGFGLFALFAALAVVFVFYVLSAMYFRQAFSLLAQNR